MMVMHASRMVIRRDYVKTTTLCGRMSFKSLDGMNIAPNKRDVTCKFCLKILEREKTERIAEDLETRRWP